MVFSVAAPAVREETFGRKTAINVVVGSRELRAHSVIEEDLHRCLPRDKITSEPSDFGAFA